MRDEVVQLLQSISKPVVAIFLLRPKAHEGKVYLAHTLEETAQIADLANEEAVKRNYFTKLDKPNVSTLDKDKVVKGLILAAHSEAAVLISEALNLEGLVKQGYILHSHGYDVMDFRR